MITLTTKVVTEDELVDQVINAMDFCQQIHSSLLPSEDVYFTPGFPVEEMDSVLERVTQKLIKYYCTEDTSWTDVEVRKHALVGSQQHIHVNLHSFSMLSAKAAAVQIAQRLKAQFERDPEICPSLEFSYIPSQFAAASQPTDRNLVHQELNVLCQKLQEYLVTSSSPWIAVKVVFQSYGHQTGRGIVIRVELIE